MVLFSPFNKALLFLLCIALLPANALSSDNAGKEQAAVFAAQRWLTLVDQESYKASWNEASENLRTSVTRDRWVELLHKDREPAGRVVSRIVKHNEYRVGRLGRENVDIYFETSFGSMRAAIESVGTRLEPDGQWRVTGYVIDSGKPGIESILMALLLAAVVACIWLMEVKSDRRTLSDARISFFKQDGPGG